MMTTMIMLIMLMMSMTMIFSKHPMSLGMTTIIQSLLTATLIPLHSNNSWFSFTLFIIFTGGLMILFIYMTSLTPNETFHFPKMYPTMILLLPMIFPLIIYSNTLQKTFPNNNTNMLMKNESMMNINPSISYLFSFPTNMLTIMLISFLLILLIITNKMISKKPGPLRAM